MNVYTKLVGFIVAISLTSCASMSNDVSFESNQQNDQAEENSNANADIDAAAKKEAVNNPTDFAERVPAAKQNTSLPANAKSGECYARVIVPPKTQWKDEVVTLQNESKKIITIPAQFKWVEKTLIVQEAGEKIVPVPTQYKEIEEKVLLKPEEQKIIRIPAQYKTVEERVLLTPEKEVWKKGEGQNEKIDSETGDVLCLVKIPAVYKTVQKSVLVSPESTKVEIIPAEYKIIKKKVVAAPATVQKIPIAAVTTQMKVRELASAATTKEEVIPAITKTVKKQIVLEPSKTSWEQILCKTNMTKDIISKVQKALISNGFYKGGVDGDYGPGTTASIRAFQKAKGLASGGLTLETLSALNIRHN